MTAVNASAREEFWRRFGDVRAAPPGLHQALAGSWLEAAQAEHASIASFAKFSLELLAVGAPPELVAGAHEAALDEIEHARICFAIASHYAGHTLGPGELDVGNALAIAPSLGDAAESAALEGCVLETTAALEAKRAAELCTDPILVLALHIVAEDEARHAELAYRFVGWAAQRGDSDVRARILLGFDRGLQALKEAQLLGIRDAELEPFGRLSAATKREVQARAVREVFLPARARLA
jgi:hypothetical protein